MGRITDRYDEASFLKDMDLPNLDAIIKDLQNSIDACNITGVLQKYAKLNRIHGKILEDSALIPIYLKEGKTQLDAGVQSMEDMLGDILSILTQELKIHCGCGSKEETLPKEQ